MSLRHGLLGLLAEKPASGYDLAKRFEELLGSVWPAKHPQIYQELGRMADEGLIEIESEGARGRKAYRITDTGRSAIRHWLVDEPVDHTMRLEPLLRSVFFWLLQPEELHEVLAGEAEYYRSMAQIYEQLAEAKDRGDFGISTQTQAIRLTVDAAVRLYSALADWAVWSAERGIKDESQGS